MKNSPTPQIIVNARVIETVRILIVTPQLPTSNEAVDMASVMRQINSIRAAGAEVDVVEVKGIRRLKYIQALPSLWKRVNRADVIHSHYGYCGWLARLQLSKPVVVSFMGSDLLDAGYHGRGIKIFNRLERYINCKLVYVVDSVIVKSEEMAEVLSPVETHIVPNGVDLTLFKPIDRHKARSKLGWPEGRIYILFPAYANKPHKGFSLAQAVVDEISEQISSPLSLIPLQHVLPEQVPLYMNACDAMLMTSIFEGSPNVVKEAMACNLPVVSVPVGDVPKLLKGVSGYTVCHRDVNKLSEALVRTLSSPNNIDGRTALRHKKLDSDSVAQQLMGIYDEVLTKRRN